MRGEKGTFQGRKEKGRAEEAEVPRATVALNEGSPVPSTKYTLKAVGNRKAVSRAA